MKMNARMAKVITLRIRLNSKHEMKIVTTVDPSMSPEMVCRSYGVRGIMISSEESNVMPLPFALNYSYRLQKQMGIIH